MPVCEAPSDMYVSRVDVSFPREVWESHWERWHIELFCTLLECGGWLPLRPLGIQRRKTVEMALGSENKYILARTKRRSWLIWFRSNARAENPLLGLYGAQYWETGSRNPQSPCLLAFCHPHRGPDLCTQHPFAFCSCTELGDSASVLRHSALICDFLGL